MSDDVKLSVQVDTGDSVDDLAKLEEASGDAGRALDGLDGRDAVVDLEARTDQLEAELADVDSELDALDGRRATVQVDVDTSDATAGLEDIGNKADRADDAVGNLAGEGAAQLGELAGATGPVSEGISAITEMALGGQTSLKGLLKGGVALAGLAGLMYALDKRAKNTAERLERVTEATENLSTVADDLVLDNLAQAIVDNVLSGQSLSDLFDKMATDNLPGFRRALDLAAQSGEFTAVQLDMMRDAIGRVEAAAAQGEATAEKYGGDLTGVGEAASGAADELPKLERALGPVEGAMDGAAGATKRLNDDMGRLLGMISDRQAWINAQEAVEDFYRTVSDPEASGREIESSWLDAAEALATFVSDLEGVPPAIVREVNVELNAGDIGAAYATVEEYFRTRPITVNLASSVPTGIFAGAVGAQQARQQNPAPVVVQQTVNNYYPPRMSGNELAATIANRDRTRGGV